LSDEERSRNRRKSKVRAKVEHPFWIMKGVFGFTKVRYRGLAKNAHHLFVSCALVNLVMAKKALLKNADKLKVPIQAKYA
jgi:IS5 family transposase